MFDVVFLVFEEVAGIAVDGDGSDCIALFNGIYNVLTLSDFTEDRVLSIEVRGRVVGDEELGAVGIGASISHGENSCFVVAEFADELIGELVSRAAPTGAGGITALDHEVRDHAVELDVVVVAALGEVEEICAGGGSSAGEECGFDVSLGGMDGNVDV